MVLSQLAKEFQSVGTDDGNTAAEYCLKYHLFGLIFAGIAMGVVVMLCVSSYLVHKSTSARRVKSAFTAVIVAGVAGLLMVGGLVMYMVMTRGVADRFTYVCGRAEQGAWQFVNTAA